MKKTMTAAAKRRLSEKLKLAWARRKADKVRTFNVVGQTSEPAPPVATDTPVPVLAVIANGISFTAHTDGSLVVRKV